MFGSAGSASSSRANRPQLAPWHPENGKSCAASGTAFSTMVIEGVDVATAGCSSNSGASPPVEPWRAFAAEEGATTPATITKHISVTRLASLV